MIEPGDPLFEHLVIMLKDYLNARPNAADTPEGILAWWLPRDTRCTAAELEVVLEHLCAEGWLERVPNASGGALYRRRSHHG